jgi:hypothetical protein
MLISHLHLVSWLWINGFVSPFSLEVMNAYSETATRSLFVACYSVPYSRGLFLNLPFIFLYRLIMAEFSGRNMSCMWRTDEWHSIYGVVLVDNYRRL